MDFAMRCPTTSFLVMWLKGKPNAQESQAFKVHLSTCVSCQERLDEITDEPALSQYRNASICPQATTSADWNAIRDRCIDGLLPDVPSATDLTSHSQSQDSTLANPDVDLNTGLPERDAHFVDGLRLERVLGSGGFGTVYLAWDSRMERLVAVKLLHARRMDSPSRERFFREVRLAADIDAQNVVKVLSAGETVRGNPYFVMEYVAGGPLSQWIESQVHADRLGASIRQSAIIIRDAANGLAAIHAAGYVHRDVKPGNILLGRINDTLDDSDVEAKLSDFGMARDSVATSLTLTEEENLLGTLAYMSPEQAENPTNADTTSDVYSLGATLYHALTGQPPFSGTPTAVLNQINESVPIAPRLLNRDIPPDLENICLKALEKTPTNRYATASDFADDIDRFLANEPVTARSISSFSRVTRWCRRHRLITTLIATSVSLLVILGIGSTVVAIRFAKANDSIRREGERARIAEDTARRDRTAAIDALSSLVDSLYRDVTDDAASIRTREKIVTAAIEGVRSVSRLSGDSDASRAIMLGHQRVGDLLSLRGSMEEARAELERAIELARTLTVQKPEDRQALRELAVALDHLVVHELRAGNDAAISAPQAEIHSILRGLLERNPDDIDVLRQLVFLQSRTLDGARHDGANEEKLAIAQRAAIDVDRLLKLSDHEPEDLRVANAIHSRLGLAYFSSGALADAKKHFLLARDLMDRAMAISPNNVDMSYESGVTDRMLGVLYTSLGQHERACEVLGNAVAVLQERANQDVEDKHLQMEAGNAHSLMSNPLHALGRLSDSLESVDRALAIYSLLVDRSPDNSHLRLLLAEGLSKRIDLLLRLERWHDAKLACDAIVNTFIDQDTNSSVQGDYYVRIASIQSAGIQRLLGEQTAHPNSTNEAIALILVARSAAKTTFNDELPPTTIRSIQQINDKLAIASFSDLHAHVRSLPDVAPLVATKIDHIEARMFAVRGQTAAQSSDPGNEHAAKALAKKAVASLQSVLNRFPNALREVVYNEPDFIWLRGTSEFQKSNIGITSKNDVPSQRSRRPKAAPDKSNSG